MHLSGLNPAGQHNGEAASCSASLASVQALGARGNLRKAVTMGHNEVWNSHPKGYGKGSREW